MRLVQKILQKLMKILMGIVLAAIMLMIAIFSYFNISVKTPDTPYSLGVTFSSRYATDLGLDWKETYSAILDELNVKKIRIPVYWDLVESSKNNYDFSDLDYQLNEAKNHNAEVILAIGQRVPRWPECFIPAWVEDDEMRKQELLQFIQVVVERYKGRGEIKIWQVENEPFLVYFGQCPEFDEKFLDEEIALVRSLDSRPILTTDSGELSLWYKAAQKGDIFGTTMYRTVYKEPVGYITYPVGPNFFKTKTWIIERFFNQDNSIVIELQGEPWAGGWVGDVPVPEQLQSMNAIKLEEHVEYARKSGFNEIYLWGAEWWYWLKKEKQYNAVWDKAKYLFAQ